MSYAAAGYELFTVPVSCQYHDSCGSGFHHASAAGAESTSVAAVTNSRATVA